jgi:hemolysin activation/secretion protein
MLKKIALIGILNFCLITFSYAKAPPKISFLIKTFSVEGSVPLSTQKIETLLTPYQNKVYNLEELQQVSHVLEEAIRAEGYSFYRVILPPQTLTDSKITLKVLSFSLNKIEIKGGHYFDRDNILASLPELKIGEPPNITKINDAIKMSNAHPFKDVNVIFKQNETAPNTIDAKITVAEQRPYQAFLSMNNTGTKRTGDFRFTAALQHGNLWNLDHQLNVSYTTSPNHLKAVKQYGFNYRLPVYATKGWLRAYYAFSDVNNGIIANDFSVTGSGEMYGLHYQHYFPQVGRYQHRAELGIDNRFFINDVTFLETPIGNSVRAVPVSFLYHGEYPWEYINLDFHLQWSGNTGLGGHNNQASYQKSRLNADKNWHVLRYGINLSTSFEQWLVNVHFTGQYSGQTLISGEQFGLGGSRSIRGYSERETSADSGSILTLELSTPRWYGASLLGFYEIGQGRQHTILANEAKSWTLSSIGLGLRWQWKNHIFTTVDFAQALDEGITPNGTHSGTNRIHANLVFRY